MLKLKHHPPAEGPIQNLLAGTQLIHAAMVPTNHHTIITPIKTQNDRTKLEENIRRYMRRIEILIAVTTEK